MPGSLEAHPGDHQIIQEMQIQIVIQVYVSSTKAVFRRAQLHLTVGRYKTSLEGNTL